MKEMFGGTDADEIMKGFQSLNPDGSTNSTSFAPPIQPYEFSLNNPYVVNPDAGSGFASVKELPENAIELALKLIEEGQDEEAILVLEAEVQRDPESSEGWRIMGEIHASRDMDKEAIQCLVRERRKYMHAVVWTRRRYYYSAW
jgi:hypothetical protein